MPYQIIYKTHNHLDYKNILSFVDKNEAENVYNNLKLLRHVTDIELNKIDFDKPIRTSDTVTINKLQD